MRPFVPARPHHAARRVLATGPPALGLLLLAIGSALPGCPAVGPLDVNDVEPIGSVNGEFVCVIDDPDATQFDLGAARYDGDLDDSGFIAGLRTQGCVARRIAAERGEVVSVTLIQQIRFDRAQVLELNVPVAVLEARADSPLVFDDTVLFAGKGGFGSLYILDPGDDPNLVARTAGGGVLLSAWASATGETISGSFTDLRMGAL